MDKTRKPLDHYIIILKTLKKYKNKIRPKVLHSIQAHCETIIFTILFFYIHLRFHEFSFSIS